MSRTHILADTTAPRNTCLTGFGRPQRHYNSTRALEMQKYFEENKNNINKVKFNTSVISHLLFSSTVVISKATLGLVGRWSVLQ